MYHIDTPPLQQRFLVKSCNGSTGLSEEAAGNPYIKPGMTFPYLEIREEKEPQLGSFIKKIYYVKEGIHCSQDAERRHTFGKTYCGAWVYIVLPDVQASRT